MLDARIEAIIAKDEIRTVLARYCRGIDRLDEALVRSCYQHEAYDDHGMFQGPAPDFDLSAGVQAGGDLVVAQPLGGV